MIEARTVPGVYIKELNAFPNSVVEVATALPVFIGYTQQASYQGKSLANKVVQISSLNDYVAFFGKGPSPQYTLAEWTKPTPANPAADITGLNGKSYTVTAVPGSMFYLFNSIQLFFQNGGGNAYVVSVGSYAAAPQLTDFLPASTPNVFNLLESAQDPTLIVMPDAPLLPINDYFTLMNESLNHCSIVQSRMTLMDIYDNTVADSLTFHALAASQKDPINVFRAGVTSSFLNYGAAYYPWLNTSIVPSSQVTYQNLVGGFGPVADSDTSTPAAQKIATAVAGILKLIPAGTAPLDPMVLTKTHNALLAVSPNYISLMGVLSQKMNLLPAASAIAGVIATVDGSQGVWKAPANVGLISVQSGLLNIDDNLQDNMNVDAISGKSVNAIRFFTGQGVLVWGGRTLDGNSQDWRYINVRRTLIMIEQSVKLAARAYVFEANDANTWLNLKSTIENFLTGIWKQGGLAGAKASDAFSVYVGLGSTMTSQDILDGYLDIAVYVAVTHPAEFIEITFQQQLQKS
jgi:phage tail sheath protein FI